MSKLSLALMSGVAAVPAAIVVILMALAFLTHANEMSTSFLVLCGVTLLTAGLVALVPAGIFVFGEKDEETEPEEEEGVVDFTDGEADEQLGAETVEEPGGEDADLAEEEQALGEFEDDDEVKG